MVRTASDELPPPVELGESLLSSPEEQAVASSATVAIPAIIVASLRVLTERLLALLGNYRARTLTWTDWGALPNDCGSSVLRDYRCGSGPVDGDPGRSTSTARRRSPDERP